MQRFVNDPDYIVEDMVKGYVKAHKDLIKRSEANDRVVQYVNAPVEGKVGLVTGGGSGHEPAFLGYVGKNMMDAVAVGEIFSSPSAQAFYDAFMSVVPLSEEEQIHEIKYLPTELVPHSRFLLYLY